MRNIQKKLVLLQIKGFTLLESLLTLFITSFLLLAVSGSVRSSFEQVEEQIFFLDFKWLQPFGSSSLDSSARRFDASF